MARIVECVPNFSEGQRKEVIEAIANAIASTDGCNLLDVDPGLSTNRTVYTFVGTPEAVVEGALNGARAASQLIDLRRHHGEHPRIGAMDVCPFIPVRGVTMQDCIECAREFAEKLALELNVPVYLYGEAAAEDYRRTVPQIRAGEYEGLSEKLTKPEWRPDFGPAEFVPTWGATLVGARKFLIAYNINLLSTKEQAHRIALDIREQGRGPTQPGKLKCVQAIGWYLEEANMAQVSVNITDHEVTPLHVVYEEICSIAKETGLAVVGSQIVGLVPLKAMMQTANSYAEKENLFLLEEDQKIRLVVDRLGLHSVGAFNPKERIIEYMVDKDRDGPLVSMDVKDFILTVGARSPTPGGGSVAAVTAALGVALGAMVGFLTYGNKKFHHLDAQMRRLLEPLYKTMKELIPFADADAAAFNDYMDLKELLPYMDADVSTFSDYAVAVKAPKSDPDEVKRNEERLQQSLMGAVSVPMKLASTANSLWPTLTELAGVANIACKSDLQVVLAAYSEYLENKFLEYSPREQVCIDLSSSSPPAAVVAVLRFVYCGELELTRDTVGPVWKTAEDLGIYTVVALCEEFLGQMTPDNAIYHFAVAEKYQLNQLAERIWMFILDRFVDVSLSSSFLHYPSTRLFELIADDKLNISSELDVYDAILRWINYDRERRLCLAEELLRRGVRLHCLMPETIVTSVESVQWLFEAVPQLLEITSDALRYHALALSKSSLCEDFPKQKPRCHQKMLL